MSTVVTESAAVVGALVVTGRVGVVMLTVVGVVDGTV